MTAANGSEGRAHVDTLNSLPASGATLKKQVQASKTVCFLNSFLFKTFLWTSARLKCTKSETCRLILLKKIFLSLSCLRDLGLAAKLDLKVLVFIKKQKSGSTWWSAGCLRLAVLRSAWYCLAVLDSAVLDRALLSSCFYTPIRTSCSRTLEHIKRNTAHT